MPDERLEEQRRRAEAAERAAREQKAREEKANAERAARLNGMKTEVMQDRKDSRTAGRKGPRETVREMKAERAAMRIGSSREGRGQTDPGRAGQQAGCKRPQKRQTPGKTRGRTEPSRL